MFVKLKLCSADSVFIILCFGQALCQKLELKSVETTKPEKSKTFCSERTIERQFDLVYINLCDNAELDGDLNYPDSLLDAIDDCKRLEPFAALDNETFTFESCRNESFAFGISRSALLWQECKARFGLQLSNYVWCDSDLKRKSSAKFLKNGGLHPKDIFSVSQNALQRSLKCFWNLVKEFENNLFLVQTKKPVISGNVTDDYVRNRQFLIDGLKFNHVYLCAKIAFLRENYLPEEEPVVVVKVVDGGVKNGTFGNCLEMNGSEKNCSLINSTMTNSTTSSTTSTTTSTTTIPTTTIRINLTRELLLIEHAFDMTSEFDGCIREFLVKCGRETEFQKTDPIDCNKHWSNDKILDLIQCDASLIGLDSNATFKDYFLMSNQNLKKLIECQKKALKLFPEEEADWQRIVLPKAC